MAEIQSDTRCADRGFDVFTIIDTQDIELRGVMWDLELMSLRDVYSRCLPRGVTLLL